jgi:hypothetical protein
VRERLPSATETEDLDIILAAAVGNALDDRVEAGNIAAPSENADALFRHDHPLTALRELVRNCRKFFAPQIPVIVDVSKHHFP